MSGSPSSLPSLPSPLQVSCTHLDPSAKLHKEEGEHNSFDDLDLNSKLSSVVKERDCSG